MTITLKDWSKDDPEQAKLYVGLRVTSSKSTSDTSTSSPEEEQSAPSDRPQQKS